MGFNPGYKGRPRASKVVLYDHFVSPTGSAVNPGTLESPWSLAHAASGAGGVLTAGKVCGLRGGLYDVQSLSFSLSGTPTQAITFRAYGAERPHIRGTSVSTGTDDIAFNGNHLRFWGVEFSRLWREKLASHTGGAGAYLNTTTDGLKFIHCVFHDGDDSVFIEPGVGAVEFYGCIVYNSGNDTNPRGHNFYIQHNDASGTKNLLIEDCISFNTFGFLVQIFAGSGANRQEGIKIRRMISFNPGVWNTTPKWPGITIDNPVDDIRRCELTDLVLFVVAAANSDQFLLIGNAGNVIDSLDVLRNYLVRGSASAGEAIDILGNITASAGAFKFRQNFVHVSPTGSPRDALGVTPTDLTGFDCDLNEYILDPTEAGWDLQTFANWKSTSGKDASSTATATAPTVNKVVATAANRYEHGRGHVWYVNWEASSRIAVDLSAILAVGDNFQVHDVRDIWGTPVTVFDAASGGNPVTQYAGATVYFPTTQVTDPPLQVNPDVNIASSTGATPIEVTTAAAHGYITGDMTRVAGHDQAAANGTRAITFVDSTHFTIDGSVGTGAGGATGIVSGKTPSTPPATTPSFNAFLVRKVG